MVTQCAEYSGGLDKCEAHFFHLGELLLPLRQTGRFKSVYLSGDFTDYRVDIAAMAFKPGTVKNLGGPWLTAVTLGVIPMSVDQVAHIEVVIRWRDTPLKNYFYRLPFSNKFSIYGNSPIKSQQAFARDFASQLSSDIENDRVLSPDFLAASREAAENSAR